MEKLKWYQYESSVECANPPALAYEIIRIILGKRYYEMEKTQEAEAISMSCLPTPQTFKTPKRNNFMPRMNLRLEENEGRTSIHFFCELVEKTRILMIAAIIAACLLAVLGIWKGYTAGLSLFPLVLILFVPLIVYWVAKGGLKASTSLLISEIERMLD